MGGDRERFEALVRAHAGAVSAYARAVAPDSWTADDAVQETFLRAWKYLDSFRGHGSFEGWLIRICRNCIIDLVTKRPLPVEEHLPERPAPPDTSGEVYDLVERLPVEQREVVALCGLLGFDYAATAEILDVPIGTVRSRLHRARAILERKLTDGDEEVTA
jgi:RNA polymerase sigma-70 factor (ECF subfamily)